MRLLFTTLLIATNGFAQSGNELVVVNKSENTISIVDTATLEVSETIPVGSNPHELAVTSDGTKAYVGNAGGNTISVIDMDSRRETTKISSPDFAFPHGIAFTPDSGRALVTSERNQKIFVIDAVDDSILRAIDTDQGGTHMVLIDSRGKWAYFTNRDSNTVSFMDLDSYDIVANVGVGQGGEGFALSPDDAEIWVANRREGTLSVIDVNDRSVVATIPAGQSPNRVALTADGNHVLVGEGGDLLVFDRAARELIESVPLGGALGMVASAPDSRRVYVAAGSDGRVFVVDTTSWTVSGSVDVGRGPDGLALR